MLMVCVTKAMSATAHRGGTHNFFNLASLRMMTGDLFKPTPITDDAISRITQLGGLTEYLSPLPHALFDPAPSYPLDPDRGVVEQHDHILLQENDASSNLTDDNPLAINPPLPADTVE